MKNIILSADGDRMVYSVPDIVADNLNKYCIEFADKWMHTSPHAKKYRTKHGVCYNEADFIDYLNQWIFPNEKSVLIDNLGPVGMGEPFIPEEYKKCPVFNF